MQFSGWKIKIALNWSWVARVQTNNTIFHNLVVPALVCIIITYNWSFDASLPPPYFKELGYLVSLLLDSREVYWESCVRRSVIFPIIDYFLQLPSILHRGMTCHMYFLFTNKIYNYLFNFSLTFMSKVLCILSSKIVF